MANPEHLAILKKGVEAWNNWRLEPSFRLVTGLNRPDLSNSDLHGADLRGIDLRNALLKGADLRGANLSEAHLRDVDLRETLLSGIDLGRADLRGANLTGVAATFANLIEAHLAHAKLFDANISWSHLANADLADAVLNNAKLVAANLTGAVLTSAHLRDADLRGADLTRANLSNANLQIANIRRTNFSSADLSEADLTRAFAERTLFSDVDLSTVQGLDRIVHSGPSTIGVDTIYKSRGLIPELFLRGAGLPDAFITYARSLVGGPIQFYSCFISYSTMNQEFADRLYTGLQANGVRCWFAPEDVQGGKKLHDQIDEAIRAYDRLLLILSEHSMNSEWVKTEIANARQREVRGKRQMLFPISLVPFEKIKDWKAFDADTGKDSAREIREYFIPDFSNWKDHGSYQKAFERLLRDLKAEHSEGTVTT